MPMKQIAARLNVSPASVHAWTKDIEIREEHRARNLRESRARFAQHWIALNRRRRAGYQHEGRLRAQLRDPLHLAGCMLYWAEGAKDRGALLFTNSDRAMVAHFWRFLSECFGVDPARVSVRLNVYLGNGLSIEQIENWWLMAVGLPRSCLRKHTIDHFPTSSSGRRRNRLPYGVCTLRLNDTRIVQHMYGAIQEYAAFDQGWWLDGRPRKPRGRSP